MRSPMLLSMAVFLAIAPASARDSLGIFEGWGAFRDSPASQNGPRCYAIARAVMRADRKTGAFAAVGTWPGKGVRGQLHLRLSRARSLRAPVTLGVGERRFTLVAGQQDAWGQDTRADAAIVAAMRSSASMSVQTIDTQGRAFADSYALRGAATAMDAAALGCARLR
ncbi:MAG: invasion associated locus B family protein [Sphingobium sp.]